MAKNAVFIHHFAKFLPTGTRIFSDGGEGLDASDRGLFSHLALPWCHHYWWTVEYVAHIQK